MNTLHLCHWQNINHFRNHLNWVSKNDSVLFFGDLSDLERQEIVMTMKEMGINWYLVKGCNDPNIPNTGVEHEINHEQWLELVIKHNNTYAWK